jgi:membrane protein
VADLAQKFMDDRALTLASLLAWGILNTFLPLLLGILSLSGLLLGESAEATAAEQRLLGLLPASISTVVQDSMAAMQRSAGGAGLISLGLLLFNGSNFFVTLESVFDLTYHEPERHLITQRVISFAALFVAAALLIVATGAALMGSALGESIAAILPGLAPLINAGVAAFVSLGGLVAMMVLMYWLLPNRHHSFRHALPGAALASVLLVLVLRLWPLYVALFGQGFNVYAAFGTVLLFMFWLYIVGVIIIAGAVLNAYLEHPERSVALAAVAARAMSGQLDVSEAAPGRRT